MKQVLKRFLLFLLLAACLSIGTLAAEPTFDFLLTADGEQTITVAAGDILTVTFALQRTDKEASFPMYAMQNEICYDSEFFRLVEGSVQTASNVHTNDIALRNHYRAFYMNTLSMGRGTNWEPTTLVGSFRLEVIGTCGITEIFCSNTKISKADGSGSYAVSANGIAVTISEDCSVLFESADGSVVESQTVKRGSCLQPPAVPEREGWRFEGWYRDVDRQIPWNFAKDTVEINLHLYAKWSADNTQPIFSDVHSADWFYSDVQYVYAKGLMDGIGDGLFAPMQNTSRAMIVTILWRMEGKPLTAGKISFTDVPYGQWYSDAIGWASAKGIVTGYSEQSFGPNDTITREQMAAILYRFAGTKGYDTTERADLSKYADVYTVSGWAKEAIAWANAHALITGMPGDLLAPQGQADRCQTAAILHRFCLKY